MLGAFEFFLSGGASNTDPSLSIGGVKSSTKLYADTVAYTSTSMPGVTLLGGMGNVAGTGQLRFTIADEKLSWKPPGATAFEFLCDANRNAVPISIRQKDIDYYLTENPGAILDVQLVVASLPVIDTTVDVTVSKASNILFPDITKSEAITGFTKYRGIYVDSNFDAVGVAVPQIRNNSAGGDLIKIGICNEAVNTTIQTLADENTAPTSVSFFQGVNNLGSNDIDINPSGAYFGLWLQQTLPPLTTVGTLNSDVRLTIGFTKIQ